MKPIIIITTNTALITPVSTALNVDPMNGTVLSYVWTLRWNSRPMITNSGPLNASVWKTVSTDVLLWVYLSLNFILFINCVLKWLGERTKLSLCTTCCTTNYCNVGNKSPQIISSNSLLLKTLLILLIVCIYQMFLK